MFNAEKIHYEQGAIVQQEQSRTLRLAYAVLEWNKRYLHRDSKLSEDLIGQCFANRFVVEPNGRRYEADRKAYKNFLDEMRSTMTSIRYDVRHSVSDEESAVFSMFVEIDKTDGHTDKFSAMLLVKFDTSDKVSLWQEVYVQHH